MTLQSLLNKGRQMLSEALIEEAGYDAKELLLFAFGFKLSDYLMKMNEKAAPEDEEKYLSLIKKRALHIPLQRITGIQGFYGREFTVFDNVLIPRYDTEILAGCAINIIDSGLMKTGRVLDLCSGSGCIGITIKAERPETEVLLSDISDCAVNAGKYNAEKAGVSVKLIKSDLFSKITGKFSLIVSNPPYISGEEMNTLMPEVKGHDPYDALYGGIDGLSFYRTIAHKSVEFLEKGGFLAFETGCTQTEAVKQIMEESGFTGIKIFKDLSGLPRVVQGELM